MNSPFPLSVYAEIANPLSRRRASQIGTVVTLTVVCVLTTATLVMLATLAGTL